MRLTSQRGLCQKMASLKSRKPCLILFLGPPTLSAYSTSFYPVVASSLYTWSKPDISRSLLIPLLPSSYFFFLIVQFGNAFDVLWDLPGDSHSEESVCNAGDPGSIPGLGRSCGEGNGNPLQYSCLESPWDRGAWWAIVHGVTKSLTWLSD